MNARLIAGFFFLASVLTAAPVCIGQTNNPQLGMPLTDAFHSFSYDHVDTANGNVVLDIPLYSLPQKGSLKLSFSIRANSAGWIETVNCNPDENGDLDCAGRYGQYAPGSYVGPVQPLAPSVVFDPELQIMAQEVEYMPQQIGVPWNTARYEMFEWAIEADGTQHSLAYDRSDPTSLRARSTDGSGIMELFSSSDPISSNRTSTIYDKSGVSFATSYSIGTNSITEAEAITDPNQNQITRQTISTPGTTPGSEIYQSTFLDSLSRSLVDPSKTSYTSSTAGCPTTPSTAQFQSLVGSLVWTPPAPSGSPSTYKYILCYTTIHVRTNFFGPSLQSCPDVRWYCEEFDSDKTVLQSVVLPNGTSWLFLYDSANPNDPTSIGFGQVQKVLLPTGGSISYTYTTQSQCAGGDILWGSLTRVISSRTTDDGLGHQATWTYGIGVKDATNWNNNYYQSVIHGPAVSQPDGTTKSNDTVITYTNLLAESCSYAQTNQQSFQGAATSTATPLQSNATSYYTSTAPHAEIYTQSLTAILPHTKSVTIPGAGTSTTTYSYDTSFAASLLEWGYSGLQTLWEYSSPVTIPFGDVTSSSTTDFDGSTVLSAETTTPLWVQDPAHYSSSYYAANLLGLPASVTTAGGGNSSTTSYAYDENNGSPQGARGNATTVSRWLNTDNVNLVTTTKYSSTGMPTSSVDANGNASGAAPAQHTTAITYDSTGLFPSQITSPSTDVSHVDYYSYDPNTGHMLTHVDQNGSSANDAAHMTKVTYDVMGRVTDVLYPAVPEGQPETQYCYTDMGGNICSASKAPFEAYSRTAAAPDPVITNVQQYDGLGRATGKTLLSDPEGPLYTDTVYDSVGQVASVSNPYRSTLDPTYDLTIFKYDALGRKLSATHQGDGSSTTWSYSGASTTSTDEVGSAWTSTTDALGRTIQMVEPGALTTQYSYDFHGNLWGVTQLGKSSAGEVARVRTFTYDSLSRLRCSQNPENTSASCPTTASATYVPGTVGYSYDPNGNLTTKTDAKGITQTRAYDALNRLLSTQYSNDSASTPSSCYQYDTSTIASSANLKGRLTHEWTQAGSCPHTLPSTGIATRRSVTSYDAQGQVRSSQQCVWTVCNGGTAYQMQHRYDLAGQRNYFTDPVTGIGLSSTFDGAGRLSNVRSSWDDATHPLHLFSSQTYSPAGLEGWMYGDLLTFHRTYDKRDRVTSEVVKHP